MLRESLGSPTVAVHWDDATTGDRLTFHFSHTLGASTLTRDTSAGKTYVYWCIAEEPGWSNSGRPRPSATRNQSQDPALMAAFKEYADYDALGLGELIAKKQVTPQEALEAAIERIEAVNPRINAVVQKAYDEARATIRAGLAVGPALRACPIC